MQELIHSPIVDSYYAALYRFALCVVKNATDAGDLTQQTFFIWATQNRALRHTPKTKVSLFQTMYREYLRHHRQAGRDLAMGNTATIDSISADFDLDFVRGMDPQLVLDALRSVPATFREPLALFYVRSLSFHEIAEILGVPIGTMISRLSRGKQQLQALLAFDTSTEAAYLTFPLQSARS